MEGKFWLIFNLKSLINYLTISSPRSFGFNAAKLAGIDHEIIRRAYEVINRINS